MEDQIEDQIGSDSGSDGKSSNSGSGNEFASGSSGDDDESGWDEEDDSSSAGVGAENDVPFDTPIGTRTPFDEPVTTPGGTPFDAPTTLPFDSPTPSPFVPFAEDESSHDDHLENLPESKEVSSIRDVEGGEVARNTQYTGESEHSNKNKNAVDGSNGQALAGDKELAGSSDFHATDNVNRGQPPNELGAQSTTEVEVAQAVIDINEKREEESFNDSDANKSDTDNGSRRLDDGKSLDVDTEHDNAERNPRDLEAAGAFDQSGHEWISSHEVPAFRAAKLPDAEWSDEGFDKVPAKTHPPPSTQPHHASETGTNLYQEMIEPPGNMPVAGIEHMGGLKSDGLDPWWDGSISNPAQSGRGDGDNFARRGPEEQTNQANYDSNGSGMDKMRKPLESGQHQRGGGMTYNDTNERRRHESGAASAPYGGGNRNPRYRPDTFEDEPMFGNNSDYDAQQEYDNRRKYDNGREYDDQKEYDDRRKYDDRRDNDDRRGDDKQSWDQSRDAQYHSDDEDVERPSREPDTFQDEEDESKQTSSSTASSSPVSPERKVITCLFLFMCCLCLLILIGILTAIGVAVARKNDKEEVMPSTPSPAAITPAPFAPVVPETQAPVVPDSPAPTVKPVFTPTLAPGTFAPTITDTELIEFLIENSFDGGLALSSVGTPQRTAYEWLLLNEDLDSYSDERILARYALATFFYSTNGPTTWDSSIRDAGWVTDAPECDWGSTGEYRCLDGIYISLTLDYVDVTGQIPLEIDLLTGLKRFSVRGRGPGTPTVSGNIPESIGSLTNLETLRLDNNEIAGTIPTALGNLKNAQVFLLNDNYLGGAIPTEIGLTNGSKLNFANNALKGSIPTEIFALETLSLLNLGGNSLTGPIPSVIGNASLLNSINFAGNDLTSSIPSEIGKLPHIRGNLLLFQGRKPFICNSMC